VFVRWNRPHKISGSFDLRFDKETPAALKFMKQTGLNMFVQGQSGRAYTPYDRTGDFAVGEPNSANAPVQITTDMRLNRWFKVGTRRFDISLQGVNIFSNRLIYRVDPITGRGYVWGQGSFDPDYVTRTLNDYVLVSSIGDPSNYGSGAQWRMTLDVDF
jgi:hypothetical protein